ncbi:glycosyltransferase [Qipengyuania flava]|uniref:glycosyltransferase n=1 Tax=Qipengyuania flava TaxID=192812 RepID=UPI00141B6C9C|nr:glycosyltransferase [Qipengyuania flava]NIJ60566.1 glycosyltransferase involved in cell wall biosynthesis [Qipengyuania flava]
MIAQLREFGWTVLGLEADLRKSVGGRGLRLQAAKFFAGLRAALAVRRGDVFFAFEPYSFISGAILSRMKGGKAIYFCRNDQVYERDEIRKYFPGSRKATLRDYVLQIACVIFSNRYVVQSEFAMANLHARYAKLCGGRLAEKTAVLSNDLRVRLISPAWGQRRKVQRIGFMSNPEWEKKGFPILRELIERTFTDNSILYSLYGEGAAFDRLKNELSPALQARVEFMGRCDNLMLLRDEVDVVFVPSVVDHFPNVVLEMACLGLPMILSDIRAHRNIFAEHACYFSLKSPADEVERLLDYLNDRSNWERVAVAQQQSLAPLTAAWRDPLINLFQTV